jgi:Ni/Fe-hydrogenase subunit HybB-like protein
VGLVGVAAFIAGLVTGAERAWTALLVNFLFWAGLAHAGVVFSAIFQITSARWARPIIRLTESTVAFLPVAGVMLLALLAGASRWIPWALDPNLENETRQAWLNLPFLTARHAVGFLLLSALSMAYVWASLRPDVGQLSEAGQHSWSLLEHRVAKDWRGLDAERELGQRRQSRLAPALLITYACVISLQAFDFIMALDPHWFSTLAGGYLFVGNLYIGLAFLALATVWIGSRPELRAHIGPDHWHDVGRMLLGFCMLWAYLFWSQYLVIWYGDLPEEIEFVARRTVDAPWAPLSWVVLGAAFVVPFVLLLSREIKRRARGLTTVALVALVGMWLERFILVGPSLWHGDGLPLGVVEVLVTAGVGSFFVLCYAAFLQRVPILPIADPMPAPDVRR